MNIWLLFVAFKIHTHTHTRTHIACLAGKSTQVKIYKPCLMIPSIIEGRVVTSTAESSRTT